MTRQAALTKTKLYKIGSFRLKTHDVEEGAGWAVPILRAVRVVQASVDIDKGEIAYIGLSDMFDPIVEGGMIPLYDLKGGESGGVTVTRRKGQFLEESI